MKRGREGHGRRAASMPLGVLILSAVAVSVLVAFGVTVGSTNTKTETFKSLAIRGDLLTGNELTLGVEYSQPYPTDVEIACVLQTTAKVTPGTPLPPTRAPVTGESPTPVAIPGAQPTPKSVIVEILRYTIGPNDKGGAADKATPIFSSTSRKFRAPDTPGLYKILCYTPADFDNQVTKSIRIEQGPAPTP